MVKTFKPYVGPGVGFLIGVALEVSPLQSAMLSGFIFGIAALWLFVTILDSARAAKRWPELLGWMPFLDQHDPAIAVSFAPSSRERELQDELDNAKRALEGQRAKPAPEDRPTASELAALTHRREEATSNGNRLELVKNMLLDRAKYGRDPKTRAELRVWMKGSADLVDGVVSRKCPDRFQSGYPHGDHPLNEQDEGCRQRAINSLRIIAANLREEHLKESR